MTAIFLRSFLPLLLLQGSFGDYTPFREPSLLQRSVLLPRKQIGVGVAIQYETCEEQYGDKFSDCYQGCYDTSTGQTCCTGDYLCPENHYCGYGDYAYCCSNDKHPKDCAERYDIPSPPSSFHEGDDDAGSDVTEPSLSTSFTYTSKGPATLRNGDETSVARATLSANGASSQLGLNQSSTASPTDAASSSTPPPPPPSATAAPLPDSRASRIGISAWATLLVGTAMGGIIVVSGMA